MKNHNKMNKQKRILKNGLSNEQKVNELRSWSGKKIICKYSLFKECFKTIIIPLDCFCHDIDDNNDSNDTNDSDDNDDNDDNDL